MDAPIPPPSPSQESKKKWSTLSLSVMAAICLLIGSGFGFILRASQVKNFQNEVAKLKQEKSELLVKTSVTPAKTSQRYEYIYGIKIPIPSDLAGARESETIIPLGTTEKYNVKSKLYNFDQNPNITILASTDAIVYENFIRSGTQAITPNPNTLTPGSPLLVNGVNFCASLKAKSCLYDEEKNTAVFQKDYLDLKNNPYQIRGATRFFPVSEKDIGKSAAVLIVRVSSDNQQLIEWAKNIAVEATK